MKITFTGSYVIDLPDCKIDTMISAFKKLQCIIFSDLARQVLDQFATQYMGLRKKPFSCKCGNCRRFIWKTKNAKLTTIMTIFCEIILPQMQVQCQCCRAKKYITRELLEIAPRHKMSEITKKAFALIGSLASFRVSEKIVGMFGIQLNRMAIWRCVQKVGKTIEFGIDANESNEFEADGTGISIQGIKKRGKELKVFIQKKISGGVRIAGLTLGNYHSGWDKLFEPLLEQLKEFKEVLILTDGDTSILDSLNNITIIVQRCLWHIPHQAKYTMWEDKIKRKSEDWLYILCKLYTITSLPRLIYDDDEITTIIKQKTKTFDKLINYCFENGYLKTYTYLLNAKPDMFTAFEKKLNGRTTSLVERVMRTVNLRIDVGKWSTSGALNALKVRLSYYYNDFDVCDKNYDKIRIQKA